MTAVSLEMSDEPFYFQKDLFGKSKNIFMILPLNAQTGNRIKTNILTWHDYALLDSLTKGDKP